MLICSDKLWQFHKASGITFRLWVLSDFSKFRLVWTAGLSNSVTPEDLQSALKTLLLLGWFKRKSVSSPKGAVRNEGMNLPLPDWKALHNRFWYKGFSIRLLAKLKHYSLPHRFLLYKMFLRRRPGPLIFSGVWIFCVEFKTFISCSFLPALNHSRQEKYWQSSLRGVVLTTRGCSSRWACKDNLHGWMDTSGAQTERQRGRESFRGFKECEETRRCESVLQACWLLQNLKNEKVKLCYCTFS